MNLSLAILAFLGGFFSFLSPCAFPLLPIYILQWMNEEMMKKSLIVDLKSSLSFSLGLETVLVIFILLPLYVVEKIISLFPIISIILGIFLIISGIAILRQKILYIQIGSKDFKNIRNPDFKQFSYGLIYAFNSLTCSLPILLMMLSAPRVGGEPIILFAMFSTGMIVPMFLLTIFSSFLGNILMKKFSRILPYTQKTEAIIAIIVGLYLMILNLNAINQGFLAMDWHLRSSFSMR